MHFFFSVRYSDRDLGADGFFFVFVFLLILVGCPAAAQRRENSTETVGQLRASEKPPAFFSAAAPFGTLRRILLRKAFFLLDLGEDFRKTGFFGFRSADIIVSLMVVRRGPVPFRRIAVVGLGILLFSGFLRDILRFSGTVVRRDGLRFFGGGFRGLFLLRRMNVKFILRGQRQDAVLQFHRAGNVFSFGEPEDDLVAERDAFRVIAVLLVAPGQFPAPPFRELLVLVVFKDADLIGERILTGAHKLITEEVFRGILRRDDLKFVAVLLRAVEIADPDIDLRQPVQDRLADRSAPVGIFEDPSRILEPAVRLVDLADHAEGPYALDAFPVHRVGN